jgi:3-methyladenine DNA glycosylase AlkD
MDKKIINEILTYKNEPRSKILARFFKTGKGEYGEGDLFLGITVPISRKIAQKYFDISFNDTEKLLHNKHHEVRLIALLILVHKYKLIKSFTKEDMNKRKEIVDFYLSQTKYINNWDLVDLSAHYTLGDYIYFSKGKYLGKIEKLAKSKNLWERRIAIISTFAFIYKKESKQTLKIVKTLLGDKEDLIHKACGWMLREVGKRVSEGDLIKFLNENISHMPRTTLRYAIERLPKETKIYYLNK